MKKNFFFLLLLFLFGLFSCDGNNNINENNLEINNKISSGIRLKKERYCSDSTIITAEVDVINCSLNWSISWSSTYNTDVNNFIGLTPSDDTLSCEITKKKNFSTQIILKCSLLENDSIYATCTIDCINGRVDFYYDSDAELFETDIDNDTLISDIVNIDEIFDETVYDSFNYGSIDFDDFEIKSICGFTICSCCELLYLDNLNITSAESLSEYSILDFINLYNDGLSYDEKIHLFELQQHAAYDECFDIVFKLNVDVYHNGNLIDSSYYGWFIVNFDVSTEIHVGIADYRFSMSGDIYKSVLDESDYTFADLLNDNKVFETEFATDTLADSNADGECAHCYNLLYLCTVRINEIYSIQFPVNNLYINQYMNGDDFLNTPICDFLTSNNINDFGNYLEENLSNYDTFDILLSFDGTLMCGECEILIESFELVINCRVW